MIRAVSSVLSFIGFHFLLMAIDTDDPNDKRVYWAVVLGVLFLIIVINIAKLIPY